MATEIFICPLKNGRVPDDANSIPGQVLKDTLSTLTDQEGFQRAYWGREVENPGTFRLFVDWDSIDAHTKFTKADHYKPFLDRFGQIAQLDQAQLYHAHLTPHPPTEVLSDTTTPATEVLVIYFPTDYSQSDQDTFVDGIKKLISAVEQNAGSDYTASAGGWIEEELPIPDSESGEKGRAYAAFIGWRSVEAHMLFRETQAFKDNIHHLRGAKDLKKLTVVHTAGTEISKGGGVGSLGGNASTSVQEEVLNPQGGGATGSGGVKSRADGTTTKNNDDLKGAANSNKKERQGRPGN